MPPPTNGVRGSNLPSASELLELFGLEDLGGGAKGTARMLYATLVSNILSEIGTTSGEDLRSAIQPAVGRIYFLEDFGVISDGLAGSPTNNQAAIQAAFDAGASGDTYLMPSGFTGWNGTVTLKTGQTLWGRGPYGASSCVKTATMGNTAPFIKPGALNSTVGNLFLYSKAGATGGVGIMRGTVSNDGPEQTRISQVKITRFDNTGYWYGGVNLDGIGNGVAGYGSRDTLIYDTLAHGCQGYGFRGAGVQNPRYIGIDAVAPDFLAGGLPGGSISGDFWITGSASYSSNDVLVVASSLDDMNIERCNVSFFAAGAINKIFIDAACTGNMFITGNMNLAPSNSGVNCAIINNLSHYGSQNFNSSAVHVTAAAPQVFINADAGATSSAIFFRAALAAQWQIRPRYDFSPNRLYFIDADESNGFYIQQNSDTINGASCDVRIKEDIRPISVLERMAAHPDVQYLHAFARRYKSKTVKGCTGPIAQLLQGPFPEMVIPGSDDGKMRLGGDVTITDDRLMGVKMEKAGIYALQGVKELFDRLRRAEAELERLKKKDR